MNNSSHNSPEAQDERRKRIREIMSDAALSQAEKSRTIQSLMDGRRRSSVTRSVCSTDNDCQSQQSYVNSMYAAAAAAAEYYSSDEDDEDVHDVIMMCGLDTASDHPPAAVATPTASAVAGGAAGHLQHQFHHSQSTASDISYGYDYSYRGAGEASLPSSSDEGESQQARFNHQQLQQLPPGSYRQIHGRSFSLQDWNDHDRAMVAAAPSTSRLFAGQDVTVVTRLMEQSRPACQHYERCCTIISPCCGLAFGCRICHDECPVLPPPILQQQQHGGQQHGAAGGGGGGGRAAAAAAAGAPGGGAAQYDDAMLPSSRSKATKPVERRRSMPVDLMMTGGPADEENHHPIDRFAIREVICRECCTRQSSKTNRCIHCGVRFGEYHCSICNLWMSAAERPYHCADCGFCRVGGREQFRHCHDCGMCIDAVLFDSHNCKSGKYMSNCPICQEDLFSSRHASHEMPCGHAIHWHCFRQLTSYDTRCPVCKKTAETPEQMASTWSAIAMGIALQPVPPDMARLVNIKCNDCERSEANRRWHFLGVRCNHCMSFNTNVEQIVMHGREAAAFLDQLEGAGAVTAAAAAAGPGTTTTGAAAGAIAVAGAPAVGGSLLPPSATAAAAAVGITTTAVSGIPANIVVTPSATTTTTTGRGDESNNSSGLSNHHTDDFMEEDEDMPSAEETTEGSSHNVHFSSL